MKTHFTGNDGRTRCGKDPISYYAIELEQDVVKVTCKACLKNMGVAK